MRCSVGRVATWNAIAYMQDEEKYGGLHDSIQLALKEMLDDRLSAT